MDKDDIQLIPIDDPLNSLDSRLDEGPPEKKETMVIITLSFEQIKKLLRRIFE